MVFDGVIPIRVVTKVGLVVSGTWDCLHAGVENGQFLFLLQLDQFLFVLGQHILCDGAAVPV
jgi:hypothetical protein